MTPAVTVLLPVHNGMPWLAEAIESIRRSALAASPLVIDDGSTDGSGRFAQIARVERRGLTRTLNEGLRYVATPLVARLDADDLMHPDRLAKQVAFMAAHPEVGLLGSGAIETDANGRVLRLVTPPVDDASLRAALIRRNPFVHSSVMFRADLVRQVGGYDESYAVSQDYALWMRLAMITKLACLPEPLVTRRMLPTGVTATRVRARRWADARVRLAAIRRGQYPASALRHVIRPLVGWAATRPRIVKPRILEEAA